MKGFFRFFKKYEWYVITSLAALGWLLGFIGFIQYFKIHEIEAGLFDTIYITIQLFTLESGFVDPPVPLILNIARYLAPFSLAFAAVMTIIWFAREQMKYSKLRRIKKHIVIFGTSLTGNYLIRDIIKTRQRIVVIGNKADISEEDIQNEDIFFIEGSPDDPELHKKARVDHASKSFYVDTDNNTNISSSLLSSALIEESGSGNIVTAYTHVSSLNTIEQLQNLDYFKKSIVDSNQNSRLDIQLFNIYERAARIIMRDYSPDIFFDLHNPGDKPACIFIAELSPLGKSLVIQAARMCHFANLKKTRVYIWDKNEQNINAFLDEYPALNDILEINFIQNIHSDHEGIIDGKSRIKPQMLYLCPEQNTVSLGVLSKLETYFLSADCKVVICHQQESDFLNNYSGENIYHFNLKEETLTLDAITKSDIDKLARAIHNDYISKEKAKGTHDPSMASHQSWEKLNEPDRNQNRNQADHLWIKLRAIDPESKAGNKIDFNKLQDAELVERLSEMEHLRWMAHKQLNGFRFSETRDNDKKLHPNIIPYDKLSEEDKQKDRDTIHNIPVLFDAIRDNINS